jgi:serine/threonine-protein kinase
VVDVALEERLTGAVVAGKYRVRRVVGAGSMGVVCEAEHLEIGKRLAIKLIDASLAGMKDIAQRFRQEARAASLVESQHIVQVFDVGADDKLGLYLVMEFLTGEDVAKLLSHEKRLPPDVAVRIAVQVARGLAKAHEVGVVHRDLKPANIFLCDREDDNPLVKILDFGISKVIDASRAESKLKLTRAGTVVGTPQYMSPEQAQGFAVDERTDVWALGLVLYEMLAGRPAYPEMATYEQFIIFLVQNPPDPLRLVAPWVPAPLAQVVHQCIEHDLKSRIPNCLDLARRLLEAHPLPGMRAAMGSRVDSADTWADGAVQSPYMTSDDSEDEPPRSERKLAASLVAPEDSLTIDVDVPFEPGPARSAKPTPKSTPNAVARSGVRGPSAEAGVEESDDAPQFFDRRALEKVSTGTPSGGVPGAQARPGVTPAVATPNPPASVLSRFPLVWAAIAFVAVGLVVALALALR